jgi:hypothetical protein
MSRIMIRAMQGKRPLLLLCTFLAISLVGIGFSCTENQPSKVQVATVASFESQNDLRQLKATDCKASLTTEHVTNGQHALEVQFSNLQTATIELSPGTKDWDWRNYGAVAIDVANPSEEEIQVGMQLNSAGPGAGAGHWSADYNGNVGPHATVSYYYGFGPSSPIAH